MSRFLAAAKALSGLTFSGVYRRCCWPTTHDLIIPPRTSESGNAVPSGPTRAELTQLLIRRLSGRRGLLSLTCHQPVSLLPSRGALCVPGACPEVLPAFALGRSIEGFRAIPPPRPA